MNIETLDATNDTVDSKITIKPQELVFPTSLVIMTIILPSIICFSILILDISFGISKSFVLLNFLFDANWNTLIGLILGIIISIYWYLHWKTYYTSDNIIRIKINKRENTFLLTKDIKDRIIDSYDFPLNSVKSILIKNSEASSANGWSVVLALPTKGRTNLYTLFVVNDMALKDFYIVGLKLKEELERLDLLKLLRISDIFLRKVKEKNLDVN